jgi:flagellar protein FliS
MTNYSKARDEYLESEVFAAGPVRRVQILYEGVIRAIGRARTLLAAKDIRGRTAQVNRAILILTELTLSLDHSAGTSVTTTLAQLYDYAQRRLLAGNASQTDEPFREVEGLLQTLLEAWRSIPEVEPSVSQRIGHFVAADNGSGDGFCVRSVDSSLDQMG